MSTEHVISLKKTPAPAPEPLPPSAPRRLPPRRRAKYPRALVIAAVCVFTVSCAAGFAFAFVPHGAPAAAPVNPESQSAASAISVQGTDQTREDSASIVAKVGALIELPQGEVPTVATVSDLSKLQGQAFFAHAKVGDIVLIYTGARKAYLYDPSENKLVEVAPITTNGAQQ
ncbi:MAG TPA: hypothetical protein VMU25_04495 [Candidatus Paceibacterota bacterium]|nr:hypothetical protein [Candidatus Paceibacterota bacterium]